jgi:uncharacterized protein (UPF0332 family)
MTVLDDAVAHLTKAREFLEAAETTHELELYNAAVSSAVSSGINSKDAICLALTGRSRKTDNHADAVAELRQAGPAVRGLASSFGRLLQLKSKSRYQVVSVSPAEAAKAIEWATRMLDVAKGLVGQPPR